VKDAGLNGSLPYSEDDEKGVLCSLILSPLEAGDLCAQQLKPEYFYAPAHKIIYEILLEWKGTGQVEFPWLKDEIKKSGQLEEVGGPEFLNELFRFVPTASNVGYYLKGVLNAWHRRSVILESRRRESAALDECSPADSFDPEGIFAKASGGYPPFESVDLLLEEKIAEPPEIVSGLVHQGSKIGIGGGSKSYKTWILTDLAVSVAAGVSRLGSNTLCGKVLYVNLELQRAFYAKRVKAISEAKRLPPEGAWRKNLEVWNLRGYCMDAETLCKRLRKLTAKGYLLVVIDPIYKIVGKREENSNEQITSLLNMLEQVARETGAAIVYGNHFSKGNQAAKDSIDRISGAGVFARDPDSIITLTKHESDGVYTVECTLRNFAPVEPFCVRWQYPLFIQDGSLNPEKLKQVIGRKPKWTVIQLVECLGDKDLKSTEFQKLVADETGMPKTNFYELLLQAKAQGLLHKCVTDDKWEVVRK
jgi:AAA domain-containing protein/DnaB helicase-like protein